MTGTLHQLSSSEWIWHDTAVLSCYKVITSVL